MMYGPINIRTQEVWAGKFKETNVIDPAKDGGIAGECILKEYCVEVQTALTLILLTWRTWRVLNNTSKWQMGYHSAFQGLILNRRAGWRSRYSDLLRTECSGDRISVEGENFPSRPARRPNRPPVKLVKGLKPGG